MTNLFHAFLNDENGFIVSAELVLVSTIGVLAMIVGLSEVAWNINQELEDVGAAFGSMNQSYCVTGTSGHKGSTGGSSFYDNTDFCDGVNNLTCGDMAGE